jgi:predicted nucleic acid-binding protein
VGGPAAGRDGMRLIVSDTGPVLHLWEARSIDLLSLAGDLCIPGAVERELSNHWLTFGTASPPWLRTASLQPPYDESAANWWRAGIIHRGEAEAIALAQQLNADWLLTDDAAARLLATSVGLEVHGSLGVVLWAAARGHLTRTEAEAALDGLAASSLWVSPAVLIKARAALHQMIP